MSIAEPFISFEISPIYEDADGCCTVQPSQEVAAKRAADCGGKAYWSLYGKLTDGTSECIADRSSFAEIGSLYERLTGKAASQSDQLPGCEGLAAYDPVDAAYLFAGLYELYHLERRASANTYSIEGAGELEDYSYLWTYALEAAHAIESTIDPSEYERMGVFAYEFLNANDRMLKMLFASIQSPAVDTVKAWCAEEGVKTRG